MNDEKIIKEIKILNKNIEENSKKELKELINLNKTFYDLKCFIIAQAQLTKRGNLELLNQNKLLKEIKSKMEVKNGINRWTRFRNCFFRKFNKKFKSI